MSELHFYLRPRPALEPICTKGSAFWRGEDRFLIKGINYFQRQAQDGGKPTVHDPKVDSLTDEHLTSLRRDIEYFQALGLNTVAVSALDPSKIHHEALKLLAEAGFYVLVKISEDIAVPKLSPNDDVQGDADFDTASYYTAESITSSLRIVDQLAGYPNLLGFVVSADSLRYSSTSKIAEVIRAHVRDIKAFLRTRGGRCVPVGVSNAELLMMRVPALKYFTAGSKDERIDFFAPDSWSWAHKSSFQISGWKNMVRMLGKVPVPMFLRQYGSYVGKRRIWEEIECLYSSDMTGVFSGGCFYTFYSPGSNDYGIVEVDEEGKVWKKAEFETLKRRFRTVNVRMEEELFVEDVEDYEAWEGEFPETVENRWMATSTLPEFPGNWEGIIRELSQYRTKL